MQHTSQPKAERWGLRENSSPACPDWLVELLLLAERVARRCPPLPQQWQRTRQSQRCLSARASKDRPSCIGSSTVTGGREWSPSRLLVIPPEGIGAGRDACRRSCGQGRSRLALRPLPVPLPESSLVTNPIISSSELVSFLAADLSLI